MQLLSVNIGLAEAFKIKSGQSGINKRPVSGPVFIGPLGVAGDAIVDLVNHGGRDQAVYLFTRPDLDWWSQAVGRDLPAGTFGENLLLSSGESAAMRAGDRLMIGQVVLEVTSPRIPCQTLNVRMNDKGFGKRWLAANRSGFYARVLQTGTVEAGDMVTLARFIGAAVTMGEILAGYPFARPGADFVARALAAPIHTKLRADLRAKSGLA